VVHHNVAAETNFKFSVDEASIAKPPKAQDLKHFICGGQCCEPTVIDMSSSLVFLYPCCPRRKTADLPTRQMQNIFHDISILLASHLPPVLFKSSQVFGGNEEQDIVEVLDYSLFTVKLKKLCHS
jgi:hypothetical protein